MNLLRRAVPAISVTWATLLPLTAFAASQPAPSPWWHALAFAVYAAGTVVCHQLPERSFHLWSAQLPVCARCTGIYVGAAAAVMVALVPLRRSRVRPAAAAGGPRGSRLAPYLALDPRRARTVLAAAAVPTVLTLIVEWTTGNTPSNAVRALAGAPLGAVVASLVVGALTRPTGVPRGWESAVR